jgi:hypothetical protein
MRIRPFFLPLCLLLFPQQGRSQSGSDPIAQRLSFVSESTYSVYLKGLEAFGTRHPGQPNRDTVAQWIARQFTDAGLMSVVLDSFSVSGFPQWNVVATITGSEPSAGEILVGAHYDSQSSIPTLAPGADDNASGTAAALEMARTMIATGYQPRRTIRFIAFGAEELGLLGSEWYASQIPSDRRSSMLMLNFDMIGTRRQDTTDRDVHIVYYDHAIAEAGRSVSTATTYTTLTPILTIQHRPHSDSWPFATRSIPCVFYIERDFSPRYHSPHDSSTYLDLAYATEITKAGLAMVLASDALAPTHVASPSLPDDWALLQNYPNPFNPETTIGWRMRERGWVEVTVWNALGQRVGLLVEGEREAGYHEAVFSDQSSVISMPSGAYFYRIAVRSKGETFSTTKVMVLAK